MTLLNATARITNRESRRGVMLPVLLGVLLAPLCGCSKTEATPPPVVNVQAAAVVRQDISEQIVCDGVLFPVAQAAIVPKITAPVRKFYVQRGAKVQEGQLLATLENKDLEAAAMDNKGGFAQAQAAYDTATKASVPEDFQKAQLDRDQAKASLEVSQQIFNSRKELFAQGAIPGRDLDTARVNLIQAQAQFETADKHLASMQAVSREAALKGAEGQLNSAKGKYLGAEAQLGYSEIRSPIRGVVTDRPLYAGEMPAPGAALITVMDTSALISKVHLPQNAAQRLVLGAPVDVHVPGLDDAVDGKVSLISPALDAGSTTVEIWIRVENPKGVLKAGTPVHATITGKKDKDALVVPSSAILTDATGKKTVLSVGSDGKAHAKEIEPGIVNGDVTEVRKGVSPGEQIVTQGAYGLEDGTKVHVLTSSEIEKQQDEKEKPDADKPGGTD